jgi:hypothetical protein
MLNERRRKDDRKICRITHYKYKEEEEEEDGGRRKRRRDLLTGGKHILSPLRKIIHGGEEECI